MPLQTLQSKHNAQDSSIAQQQPVRVALCTDTSAAAAAMPAQTTRVVPGTQAAVAVHGVSRPIGTCVSCRTLSPRPKPARKQTGLQTVVVVSPGTVVCCVAYVPLTRGSLIPHTHYATVILSACRQIACDGPTCRIPILLTAAGAVAAAYWFKRQAELPKRKLPEPWPEVSAIHTGLSSAVVCLS